MIKAYLILSKHWEYDDSFYNFVGHDGVAAVCFARDQAEERVRRATADFVRRHSYGLDRFEEWRAPIPWDEREGFVGDAEDLDDDRAVALAATIGLEPFTIQEVLITPEFLHAARLSPGKRTALLRKLGATIRPLSPAAADHLESHEE